MEQYRVKTTFYLIDYDIEMDAKKIIPFRYMVNDKVDIEGLITEYDEIRNIDAINKFKLYDKFYFVNSITFMNINKGKNLYILQRVFIKSE